MKKIWSKITASLVITSIVFSLAACGNGSSDSAKSSDTAAASTITNNTISSSTDKSFDKFKGTKLTFWYPFTSSYIKSINDNVVIQEMEKITGIKIDFITPTVGQESEAFNLMIASGEYPDIISEWGYKGGGLAAVQDGVYRKLNDDIAKYAPNYTKLMSLKPDIAKQAKEDDGTIWSFKCIQAAEEPSWAGPIIRKDYLDELGLQVPQTIDEWHTVLTAFKEKKKLETPMLLLFGNLGASEAFTGTFNSSWSQFINKNGTVAYGPIEPGFKDFVTLMSQWYKEGLIDKDFATRDNKSSSAQFTSGKAGATTTSYYGDFGPYTAAGKAADPKFNLVPTPYPVINKGDDPAKVLHLGNKNWYSKGCDLAISTSCKNVEAAIKWIDYRYSDAGFMLFNYGIENLTYKWVDGAMEQKGGPDFFPPTFTDKLKKQH